MRQVLAVLNSALIILLVFFAGQTVLNFAKVAEAEANTQVELMRSYISSQENDFNKLRYSKLNFTESESDLYLTLLNEVVFLSDIKAQKAVRQAPGINANNLDDQLRASEALRESYQLESNFYQTLAKHEAEVIALEIFVNASTKDADVDLLDDLNKIEKLMFAEESPSQFQSSLERSADNLEALDHRGANLYGDDTQPSQSNNTNSSISSSQELSISLAQDEPLILDESICQADSELAQSLKDYNAEIEQAETDLANAREAGESYALENSAAPKRLDTSKIEVNKKTCPDEAMFCLRVEQIWTEETSYTASSRDCINCLIQDLQRYSDELISQSVAAHSLPGEPFQPNICLKSFGLNSLDLDFHLVKRPLVYNDEADILTQSSPSSIAQQIQDLQSTTENDEADVLGDTLEASTLGGDLELSDLIGQTQAAQDFSIDQARVQGNLAQVQAMIEANEVLVNALENRMQATLSYFESYQEILMQLALSLDALKEKPYCPS